MLHEGYRSGDKLPTERELATKFGVGRSSVREALKALQALGFLEIRQGSGCYVQEVSLASLFLPIKEQLYNKRILIEEIVETRIALESEIIQLAIQRATPVMLDKINRYLHSDEKESFDYDPHFAFEQMLAEMAGNRILIMMQNLIHQLWRDATNTGWRRRSLDERNAEHLDIFHSIRTKDVQGALEKMRQHLWWAVERFDDLNI
ncbi:GntR family transcriptional regulator [Alicyclobacillus tolerans]|nr:GntR family transcriptional regulator [Alicyclobacillus tolerans]